MKSIGELVIDLDAGLKTDEQLNLIGKIADYLENVNYRNNEEER